MSSTGVTPAKEEVTFYSDNDGVRVTNTRLIVGSTTYAMRNMTSVSRHVQEPNRVLPLLLCILGSFCVMGGAVGSSHGAIVPGIFMLGIGIGWWKLLKPRYSLLLASSSGETKPITSLDGSRIESIVRAVNEAIIERG